MSVSKRVVLVTGGSSGIGKAICHRLSLDGHLVYGTSRKVQHGDVLDSFKMLRLDVTDDRSVQEAIDRLISLEGRIDLLVNNAGIGFQGPLEDTSPEVVHALFDTNLVGMHRVTRAVLPHMRGSGRGTIVNIASIAANMGLPYRGFYSASKASVERYSEALNIEVSSFGIHVVVVEPGDFRSNTAEARVRPTKIGPAYQRNYEIAMQVLDRQMSKASPPTPVAERIARIANSDRPRYRYRVAKWFQKLAVHLRYWLPARSFQRLLGGHFR